VRKIAHAGQRDVGRKTRKIIEEFNHIVEAEKNSQHRYEDRVIMLETLRDFFAEKLLKDTEVYNGLDEFNRHGILHGIFVSYGSEINFFRAVTLLDMLCYVVKLAHGGSNFAPDCPSGSDQLARYYASLQQQSARRPVQNP
jgi:hypothetical protein